MYHTDQTSTIISCFRVLKISRTKKGTKFRRVNQRCFFFLLPHRAKRGWTASIVARATRPSIICIRLLPPRTNDVTNISLNWSIARSFEKVGKLRFKMQRRDHNFLKNTITTIHKNRSFYQTSILSKIQVHILLYKLSINIKKKTIILYFFIHHSIDSGSKELSAKLQ